MARALMGLLVLGLLVGCSAARNTGEGRLIYVAAPPPEPLPEAKSGPTSPEMIWVAGYWHWNGVRYVWIPGHWESPRPDQSWEPPAYSFSGGRWTYRPGQWALAPSNQ